MVLVLADAVGKEKDKRGMWIRVEETKLFLFVGDRIIYMDNLREPMDRLLELVRAQVFLI